MAKQQTIDWSRRGADLRAIRACWVGDPNAKHALRVIDDRIGTKAFFDFTMQELADDLNMSRASAYAKVKVLESLGIVDVDPVGGGRKRFRLNRERILELDQPPPKKKKRGRSVQNLDSKLQTPSPDFEPASPDFEPASPDFELTLYRAPDSANERQTEARAAYDADSLGFQSRFIERWNACPGVAKCQTNALAFPQERALIELLDVPGWWENALAAMAKFPLQNGAVISMRKFLQPTTVDEILGGVHDFDRTGSTQRSDFGSSETRRLDAGLEAIDDFLHACGVREGDDRAPRIEADRGDG